MTDAPTPLATALAGGAIASALLETLYDKGILDLNESRGVLDKAIRGLGVVQVNERMAAAQIIGSLLRGKFSARG